MPWLRSARWLACLATVLCAVMGIGACQRTPYGRLRYSELASAREGKLLHYGVYLPPGWDGARPLPVVLLLHGAGDDHTSADREQVVHALDGAIRSGKLPPFVLVAPEGERGFWLNWYDGSHHYRDWVMDEVLPALRARYPLLPEPQHLHLIGVSMGGGGMQLWLHERERFASASIVSAPILNEPDTRAFLRHFVSAQALDRVFGPAGHGSGLDPYAVLSDAAALHGSKLLFAAARADRGGILDSNRAFDRQLRERAVPHQFLIFPGKHRWTSWAEVLPYVLCLQLSAQCTMAPPAQVELH
jgi:enterochelin esterase-like enzyme